MKRTPIVKSPFFSEILTQSRYDPYAAPDTKKQKRAIARASEAERDACWDRFIGRHNLTGVCVVCRDTMIYFKQVRGWEAGHIVAYTHCQHSSYYMLVPMCMACNNACGQDNVLDFMYEMGRIKYLTDLCWTIFELYKRNFADALQHDYNGMMHRLIEGKYGQTAYKTGGFVHGKEIRTLLIHEEVKREKQRQIELNKQCEQSIAHVNNLLQET
jgi:hypothetical protein